MLNKITNSTNNNPVNFPGVAAKKKSNENAIKKVWRDFKRDAKDMKVRCQADFCRILNPDKKSYLEVKNALFKLSGDNNQWEEVCRDLAKMAHSFLLSMEDLDPDIRKILEKDPVTKLIAEKLMRLVWRLAVGVEENDINLGSPEALLDRVFERTSALFATYAQKIVEVEKGDNKRLRAIFHDLADELLTRIFPGQHKDKSIPAVVRISLKVLAAVNAKYSWNRIVDYLADNLLLLYCRYQYLQAGEEILRSKSPQAACFVEEMVNVVIRELDDRNIEIGRDLGVAGHMLDHIIKILFRKPNLRKVIATLVSAYISTLLNLGAGDKSVKERADSLKERLVDRLQLFYEDQEASKSLYDQLVFDLVAMFLPGKFFTGSVMETLRNIIKKSVTDGSDYALSLLHIVRDLEQLSDGVQITKIEDYIVDQFLLESSRREADIFGFAPLTVFSDAMNDEMNNRLQGLLLYPGERNRRALKLVTAILLKELSSADLASYLERIIEQGKLFFAKIEAVDDLRKKDDLYWQMALSILGETSFMETIGRYVPDALNKEDLSEALATGLSALLKEGHQTGIIFDILGDRASVALSPDVKAAVGDIRKRLMRAIDDFAADERNDFPLRNLWGDQNIRKKIDNVVDRALPVLAKHLLDQCPDLEKDPAFLGKGSLKILRVVNAHLRDANNMPRGISGQELESEAFYAHFREKLVGFLFKSEQDLPLSAGLREMAWRKLHTNLAEILEEIARIEDPIHRHKLISAFLEDELYKMRLERAEILGDKTPGRIPRGSESLTDLAASCILESINVRIDRGLHKVFGKKARHVKRALTIMFFGLIVAAKIILKRLAARSAKGAVRLLFRDDFPIIMRKALWEMVNVLEGEERFDEKSYGKGMEEEVKRFLSDTGMLPRFTASLAANLTKRAVT